MRFLRILVGTLALAATSLGVTPAGAAVTVEAASPVWSARPDDDRAENLINQADCLLKDATLTFDVSMAGFAEGNLFQVWSGTTCNLKDSRTEDDDCVQVLDAIPENTAEVTIKVQDIVQKPGEGAGIGTGTDATCLEATSTASTPRSLFFVVLNQADQEPLGFDTWEFEFDLTSPAAPTGLSAGPGESSLSLEFEAPDGETITHYRFYCSDVASEMPADPDTSAGGADSGSSSNADGTCTSTKLIAGQAPPAGVDCGRKSATASDSGTTDSDLTNGATYAVAVAAEDKFGNVSVLSNIDCATPAEVTGFYEAYRAAGGQGGGGFCSFAPARRAAIPIGIALLVACAALVRRRR
jgi:hypothetical protein